MTQSMEKTNCPYCSHKTELALPDDYRPVYRQCNTCGKKFIAERLAKGFQALTLEEAPCCSDPDCIALETAGSDEE